MLIRVSGVPPFSSLELADSYIPLPLSVSSKFPWGYSPLSYVHEILFNSDLYDLITLPQFSFEAVNCLLVGYAPAVREGSLSRDNQARHIISSET